MHIGFLACDLSHRHGWAHYSLSLIQALRRAGVQLTVISAQNSPEVEGLSQLCLLPNTYPAAPGLLLNTLRTVPAVRDALRACDVLHATIEPYAPAGAWTAGKRPLFVTAHGSYAVLLPGRRWPAGLLYQQALRRAHVVCVSRYTAHAAQMALPGLKTRIVNNGVDFERFGNLSPLAAPRSGPTVLAVGAVKARKGTLALIRAMAEVRQRIPAVRCVVIGSLDAEPAYTTLVKTEIERLGLGDCIHLLGHVDDSTLLAWYGTADVFALPSLNLDGKFEGYGIAYLEASAAGLPVIGTRGSGAEDAIIDGVTGVLIPQSETAGALAAAIIEMLTNPARAAAMGTAGRDHARQQTWNHVAQCMIGLYEEALQS